MPFNLKKANWNTYYNESNKLINPSIIDHNDPIKSYNNLEQAITKSAQLSIPKYSKNAKRDKDSHGGMMSAKI